MTSTPDPFEPPHRGPDPAVYPPAERGDDVEELHGYRIADPYRWLEDAADPRTTVWSAAQDQLLAEHAGRWPGRPEVLKRLTELLSGGAEGVPVWRGERRFFMRRTGRQEHAVLLLAEPDGAGGVTERVLLDPMQLDPGGLTTLDAWQPDREGRRLAYQVSEGGTEESVLRVIDVDSGELLDGPIDRARYSPVSWIPGGLAATSGTADLRTPDGGRVPAFYYVRRLDPAGLPEAEQQYHRRVWLHRLGTDPARDVEVFGAGRDPRTYYGVGLSRDGRWLSVSAAVGTAPRNDVYLADLDADLDADLGADPDVEASGGPVPDPHAAPVFRPVAEGLDAQVGAHVGRDGRLYISTDLDAPRGRLAVTDPTDPGPETWRDLLPQDPEAVLEDYAVLDGPELGGPELGGAPLLLAGWTRHAVSEVTAHRLADGARLTGGRGEVPLPGLGSIGGLMARPEGGHEAWFSYTDHVTPPHIYRLDARTGEVTLFARPPGAVEVPAVSTRQVSYTSKDGTVVRMFLTARTDLLDRGPVPGGELPTILYGYGGFAVPLTPGYSASILAWAEAGGLYAVANLRGGSEEGEGWHRAGMLEHKQNVFDDFHAAAEYLQAEGWTTAGRLAISGGSNGGLLVGAALTQRPELFSAVVCSAPLLDMVRYERFGLGATWNVEYGSADDPDQLPWLLGYSPYHRVIEGVDYPATLFTVFDGDSRVDPMHARKLCAALQHAVRDRGPGGRPILIRTERDVGHGARAMSRSIELSADTLVFCGYFTGLAFGGADLPEVP